VGPFAYLVAIVASVGLAVWLQFSEPLPRNQRILCFAIAGIFSLLLVPAVMAQPTIQTATIAALFILLPFIALPYQQKVFRLIRGGNEPQSSAGAGPARGPGGGRIRPRTQRRGRR
jgi:hypothetical protein